MLNKISVPFLNYHEKQHCGNYITEQKILDAIKSISNNKTPVLRSMSLNLISGNS